MFLNGIYGLQPCCTYNLKKLCIEFSEHLYDESSCYKVTSKLLALMFCACASFQLLTEEAIFHQKETSPIRITTTTTSPRARRAKSGSYPRPIKMVSPFLSDVIAVSLHDFVYFQRSCDARHDFGASISTARAWRNARRPSRTRRTG